MRITYLWRTNLGVQWCNYWWTYHRHPLAFSTSGRKNLGKYHELKCLLVSLAHLLIERDKWIRVRNNINVGNFVFERSLPWRLKNTSLVESPWVFDNLIWYIPLDERAVFLSFMMTLSSWTIISTSFTPRLLPSFDSLASTGDFRTPCTVGNRRGLYQLGIFSRNFARLTNIGDVNDQHFAAGSFDRNIKIDFRFTLALVHR